MEETRLVTIDDVCKSGSSNVSQNKLKDIEGIYPIYGASGLIKNVDFYHQEKPYLSIVKDGSGYGRITKMSGKTSVIGTLQYLLPKDNIVLDYLYYGMQSIDFKKYVSGAAIPHIYFKDYKKEPILLRPIEEQQTIVAKLDQAFAAIDQAKANIEKNIANAKELFQSKLNQIFSQKGEGWVERTLQELCEKITDGTHQTPKYFESGYIFLSSKNVTSGKIDWNNVKYLDESQHLELQKRVSPKVGDILLAKNGTTGVAAIVDKDVVFDIYVSLAWIRSKGEVIPEFLLHYINSPLAKSQFNARLKGIGVPNLHLKEIKEVNVNYPINHETQRKIVFQLDQLQEQTNLLVTKYQQKLANLEELKKSILEKAFKGELSTAAIEKV